MSEATLNPPTLEQINRDLAKTVSEEMLKNERLLNELKHTLRDIETFNPWRAVVCCSLSEVERRIRKVIGEQAK